MTVATRHAWHDRLALACGIIAGTLFVLCALLIFYEVVMRKLGQPSVWSEEVAVYMSIWATYLGLAYAEASDTHIRMSILSDRMESFPRYLISLFSSALTAVFLIILIWYGYEQALKSFEQGRQSVSVLRFSMVYLHAALPVGGVLILLQVCARIVGGRHPASQLGDAPE